MVSGSSSEAVEAVLGLVARGNAILAMIARLAEVGTRDRVHWTLCHSQLFGWRMVQALDTRRVAWLVSETLFANSYY